MSVASQLKSCTFGGGAVSGGPMASGPAGFPRSSHAGLAADPQRRGLAPSGFKLCVSQTPLGVEINMATIWLLLHVGKRWSGREGKNKRTGHCRGPPISQTPWRPRRSHTHDVTVCSTAAGENPWVSSCVLAACGFAAEPKVTFPRAAPRFPTGFPLRGGGRRQGVSSTSR